MDTLKSLCGSHRPHVSCLVVGGAVVVTGIVANKILYGLKKPAPLPLVEAPADTAVIYQFKRGPNAPSASPYPMKLETYCRMAKIPYLIDTNSRMSSRGKIPWITYNGEVVEDSQFCIEYFNDKLGIDVNSHLSTEEKAAARFIQVLADEHFYWCLEMFRWIYSDPKELLDHLGFPRHMVPIVKQSVIDNAHGQGIGRHSQEQVKAIMMEDIKSLSDFLGSKPFMLGEKMCQADCSVFGMMSQLVWHPPTGLEDVLKDKFPNLHQYCHRIKDELWPDWDEACKNFIK